MAKTFRTMTLVVGFLASLLGGCSSAAESADGELMPAEMPEDFYVAVREKGGGEPTDNVYFLSPDSASREVYYYNYHSLNAYSPEKSDVETVYQALRSLKPWDIGVREDEVNRVYERGGVLFEIGTGGRRIDRSNADRSHVLEASLPVFQQVTSTVRDEVLDKLRTQLQPVRISLRQEEAVPLTKIHITANDFPLLKWEDKGDGKAPPTLGQNAILPGDYHIFIHLRTDLNPLSIQDSISIHNRGRDLELVIGNGSLELNKLN